MGGAMMSGNPVNKRDIGLSVVSLLPHSLLPVYGMWYAEYIAREAGYDGLQLIPFWSYSGSSLESFKHGLPILSYEGSWNHMYFDSRTTLGRICRLDMGVLLDTALFGTQRRVSDILDTCLAMFPEAIRIDIDPYGVREVLPHHGMSRNQWIGYPGGVAFDTYHVFELPFIYPGYPEVSALNFFLDLLSGERVEILHVQFRDARKLAEFLSKKDRWENPCFENLVLTALSQEDTDIPVIVEIHPKLLPFGKEKRIQLLRSVKERIRSFLN